MLQSIVGRPLLVHFVFAILGVNLASYVARGEDWVAGRSKVDITPKEEVRLSGYAVRKEPTSQVADPLSVRALAMRYRDRPWQVILSIDTIGMPASLTDQTMTLLKEKYGLDRRQVVFCGTHSHYAPHLVDSIPNLFDLPLNAREQEAAIRYTEQVKNAIVEAVGESIDRATPAMISIGEGEAGFAQNRRPPSSATPATENSATVQLSPVDRAVRVLRVIDSKKNDIAVAYQYACHCTTIPAQDNRVSADWAGLSARAIEASKPGCIALPIIGCGADANPTPRGSYELAIKYGDELAKSVTSVCRGTMEPLAAPDKVSFDFVALSCERPSREKLQEMLKSTQPQQQRFAASMIEVWQRRGRIPETYPEPVHLWRFGKQLTWVFLGGEVVVDYQLRLANELRETQKVWVAGYTDDVFAYIASERVRNEGGYEADTSMLYYNRPGRWESGTEQLLVDRIINQSNRPRDPDEAMPVSEALESMHAADGLQVQMMACEPMVEDPVNIAFDARGRVWILEMGDYPLGNGKGGRVKILEDTDGDGALDSSKIFLDGLDYPSGIYPWRDGVIVASAPDVFWARDMDGDDRADHREVLITGFASANPQHRVHGFTYGLDHRLHFGTGEDVRQVTTPRDGKVYHIAGCDLSLDVDSGTIQLETGKTQYIRGRDDWGNWFGNDNIHPMFHYVIEHRYRRWNDESSPITVNQLMHPETAPPVYPLIRSADRYNDVHTANCYTSACSSIICRGDALGKRMEGALLVCEPVHNMVGRAQVIPAGSSMQATRMNEDRDQEFLRSSDPWSRPVRVENAPDGSIWVVDMVRRVIEHPEWIPEDWQARIDLRAGERLGRVYRIAQSITHTPFKDLTKQSNQELLDGLTSPQGALRDLAQQQLIQRADPSTLSPLRFLAVGHPQPLARLHAIATMRALGAFDAALIHECMRDQDPRVARQVVRWSEDFPWDSDPKNRAKKDSKSEWVESIERLARSSLVENAPELSLQILLSTLGESESIRSTQAHLLRIHGEERWHQSAVLCLPTSSIDGLLRELIATRESPTETSTAAVSSGVLVALLQRASASLKGDLLSRIASTDGNRPAWHYTLATGLSRAEGISFDRAILTQLQEEARLLSTNLKSSAIADESQLAAVSLLSSSASSDARADEALFFQLLRSCQDLRIANLAIDGLTQIGDPQCLPPLFRDWNELTPRVQSKLLQHVMMRSPWQLELLSALEKGLLKISDLDPLTVEQWSTVQNQELQFRFAKLVQSTSTSATEKIQKYENDLPKTGNLAQGRALFDRHCALCHRDSQGSPAVGPNLLALNEWNDQQWIVAILDPNRSVEGKYRRMSIILEDGVVLVGLLRSESETSLELVLPDGSSQRIEKSEIASIKNTDRSLMPEGFDRFLTPEDIRDILTYLRTSPEKQ